jgi:hypothetical protein
MQDLTPLLPLLLFLTPLLFLGLDLICENLCESVAKNVIQWLRTQITTDNGG